MVTVVVSESVSIQALHSNVKRLHFGVDPAPASASPTGTGTTRTHWHEGTGTGTGSSATTRA